MKKFWHRILDWSPIWTLRRLRSYWRLLYEDRDWSWVFIIYLEKKKYQLMIDWYERNDYGHWKGGRGVVRDLKIMVRLIDIITGEDPCFDVMRTGEKFLDYNISMNRYVNTRNAARFAIPNSSNDIAKSYLYEQKAWTLYSKIREYKMRTWWD